MTNNKIHSTLSKQTSTVSLGRKKDEGVASIFHRMLAIRYLIPIIVVSQLIITVAIVWAIGM
jgi:hypothetical protein